MGLAHQLQDGSGTEPEKETELSESFFQGQKEEPDPPEPFSGTYQKNPRVHKIRVRNSGAGNGCANFYGRLEKCALSAGKPVSIKFLVLGGGGILGLGGGGVPILFLWARGFFRHLNRNWKRAIH